MNKQHLALSLSVGILGGISVFLASNILSSVYLIWVGFIAWGLFFKNGGDNDEKQHNHVIFNDFFIIYINIFVF